MSFDRIKLPVWRPLYYILKALRYSVAWEISVGAVVFRISDGIRYYLLLRYPSGHYDFARGHKEEGESDRDTLLRETREETGITDLEILDKPVRFRFFYVARGNERDRRNKEGRGLSIFKEVLLFPAKTFTASIALSHEHSEFLWLPFADAVNRATYPNAKKALIDTETFLGSL